MKRWAALTVLVYVLILAVLTAPAMFLLLGDWWGAKGGLTVSTSQVFHAYDEWSYWLWLGILALGQVLLLLVPVDISERRFPARRRLLVPIIVTAFFLMCIFVSGAFSLLCLIFNDNAFGILDFYNKLAGISEQQKSAHDLNNWLAFFTILFVFWTVWGLVFYRFAKTDDPNALTKRSTRWLLRGSILELLVAVPSHIIVRNRNDCCAPMGTFWGITTGLCVMLLSFGPGVFFLFAERMQRSRPKSPAPTPQAAG